MVRFSGFLSTLSLRRATRLKCDFIIIARNFYPRSPCGERPCHFARHTTLYRHFYPRSPCGERPNTSPGPKSSTPISIHALLAESDMYPSQWRTLASDFYPRSPCGERLSKNAAMGKPTLISIHALLAESDIMGGPGMTTLPNFYPRSPCGERHTGQPVRGLPSYFYPRSPCGERPCIHSGCCRWCPNFYPRSPCGERPVCAVARSPASQFLSTLSLRRATGSVVGSWPRGIFLSTLSLRRATKNRPRPSAGIDNFYPRSPCGERQQLC